MMAKDGITLDEKQIPDYSDPDGPPIDVDKVLHDLVNKAKKRARVSWGFGAWGYVHFYNFFMITYPNETNILKLCTTTKNSY